MAGLRLWRSKKAQSKKARLEEQSKKGRLAEMPLWEIEEQYPDELWQITRETNREWTREEWRRAADDWCRGRLESGDFRSLAKAVEERIDFSRYGVIEAQVESGAWRGAKDILGDAVRAGNPEALRGISDEIDASGGAAGAPTHLESILIDCGDERVVPILRKALSKSISRPSLEGFIARFDVGMRQQLEAREAERERTRKAQQEWEESARRVVREYDEPQMVDVLRQLCGAYAGARSADDPEVRRLEPLATAIGERLYDIGGLDEMRRVFAEVENLAGSRTLDTALVRNR